MPLLVSEQVDIRRHLQYPIAGLMYSSPAGGQLAAGNIAYRFLESYGQLEARLYQLAPQEEAALTGKGLGAIGFNQPGIPVVGGSVITVTINNAPNYPNQFSAPVVLTYTVQASDTLLTICNSIAQLAALDVTFTSAGGYAVGNYGIGPVSQQIVPFPIASFICLEPFMITCTGAGNTIPQLVALGGRVSPTLYIDTTIPAIPIYGYIAICNHLENAFFSSTNNLSVSKAREATLRPSELREREWLYQQACIRMAKFMGISINPHSNQFGGFSGGVGPKRLMV